MDRQNEGELSRGTRQDSPSDVNDAGEENHAKYITIVLRAIVVGDGSSDEADRPSH